MKYFRWLVPATIAVPLLMLGAIISLNRVEVRREAEAGLLRDTDVLYEHALKVFETQELLVAEMARRAETRRARDMGWDRIAQEQDLHGWMAGMVARYAQLDSLALVDGDGQVRLSSRMFPTAGVDIADRSYFQKLRQGGSLAVSETLPSRMTGRPHFNLARRLERPDGSFDGLALASIRPDYFLEFWRSAVSLPGTAVALVRLDGAVLARWPALPRDGTDRHADDSPLVRQINDTSQGLIPRAVTPDGITRLVAFRRLGRYPLAVLAGRTPWEIYAPWRRDALVTLLVGLAAMLLLLPLALLARRSARREQGAVASLRHEAARRASTEQALRQSEARYRGYFANTGDLQFVLAVRPDGGFGIEDVNPAFEAAAGPGLAALRGRGPDMPEPDMLEPDTLEPAGPGPLRRDWCRRCVETGERQVYQESSAGAEGKRDYEVLLVPLRDDAGAITRILGSARDVTERRQAQERLFQAQKLETVGQLTGGVAHDFNNLLTAIVNNLELARRDPAGAAERLEGALKAARAGTELVRRLLAFARMQPLEPQPTDPGRLLHDILPLLRRAVGERVEVSVTAGRRLPPVLVDPVQLENALLNLAVNARDAMPGGGRLEIRAGVELAEDGTPQVVLTVADTGTGMTPEVAQRMFEPFFTTKPPGKGTGLGLASLYGFVRQSGGQVRVETAPGRGTVFHLSFPARPGLSVPSQPAEPSPPAMTGVQGARVLLVEDEALVRLSTVALLRDLGYRVEDCASAEAALERLAGSPDGNGEFDLLLTDIGLPGMDGRTLASRAAELRPGMAVVLMTGYDRTGSDGGGRWAHLDKPFAPQHLAETVARALGGERPLAQAV
ncbi:ATP-binding protein [Rhodospirillum centenum]|uniref:histidine kinase n=1 Tax=Rhodospirillum centenum (strain ATCC 51521 / SW) TaxID=414684 RepID=B6IUE0_RHOCS|nr:ATP-binding protein [Rhodospirillum centenum]ACJ00120.1 sensory box histidine kinase [Rhodospirillum centenum SW]